jgi:hypothetical protein
MCIWLHELRNSSFNLFLLVMILSHKAPPIAVPSVYNRLQEKAHDFCLLDVLNIVSVR